MGGSGGRPGFNATTAFLLLAWALAVALVQHRFNATTAFLLRLW